MNKEDYIISIVGEQKYEDERDNSKINLDTLGTYFRRGKAWHITYREYDEDNPQVSHIASVKVEDLENNRVTMTKAGGTKLILEKDKRHSCAYNTLYGALILGVYTSDIESTLDENGGELKIRYTLDINSSLASENSIHIKVKKAETERM